ncbi:hypothetical protein E4634_10870 [Mangrovimicrobium sediminis]|uniref:Sel1 repeat family protein n=1 Tax=Mangrovimicrobium sediminis TaxID=2562682 RepID=A0A4Z0M1F1_9GAMM|nr:hypothetical protein [Haliea sp. SAOS-164]TGD73523.1 hypothetical protein E4634_10870 [Haliea sp. SAOS-164]
MSKTLYSLLPALLLSAPGYASESITGLESLDEYSKNLCSTYTSDVEAEKHDNMDALPLCYMYGLHRKVDLEKAKEIFLSRAKQRPWNYADAAGVVFHEIKDPNQYIEATSWLNLAVEKGDVLGKANCYLGLLNLTGRVVAQNLELAEEYLSTARRKDFATCVLISYYLYTTGDYNIEINPKKAGQIKDEIGATSPTLKSAADLEKLFPKLRAYVDEFGAEWERL